MGTERTCPRCGAALSHGEVSLCPVCVSVFAGLEEDRTSTALEGDLFTPDDLATLFPELTVSQLVERREEALIYAAEEPVSGKASRLTVAPCLDSDELAIESCLANLKKIQKLDHPNIVPVLSCGERDGCLFLLTEIVEGRRLSEFISTSSLNSPEALDLVGQLVSAIQEMKRAGLNESSPKIEDVFVSDDGRLVIADFGLERMLRVTEDGNRSQTSRKEDSASRDASSLGALFYELLAGEALPKSERRQLTNRDSAVSTVGLLEDRVDGYRLSERIGEGGFGIVYLAEQLGAVKRKVALKILKPGMDSAEVISRFQAERQALALLDDPNTAAIYDAGETEKGRPFFAMELVDGKAISDFCRVHKLDLEARLDLFLQVCNAVRHAHQRGLIHRDLKPSNILVQPDPQSGTKGVGHVKVIDFGIAKATEGALTEETMHTRAAQILGTPNYMSPEQARMEPGSIDTRSDIYSLGAILYELLTGTTPFETPEKEKVPLDEMFRLIREEDPPSPGDRLRKGEGTSGALNYKEVRGDLNWIVMKALRKTPAERYHSVAEFSADIRKFLNDEAVDARPPSVVYSFRKFVRRHRTLAAALVVGAITLLVGSIVSTSQFLQARQHAAAAEENARERRTTFSRADFLGSQQLLGSDDPSKAVAQLARAVRTDRSNRAASFKLLHTLTKYNFLQPLVTPMVHNASAHEVVFSPDGELLASVAKNGEAAIWDAATGECLHWFEFSGVLSDCNFDPAGKRLVVTGHDPVTKVIDVQSGAVLHSLNNGTGSWGNESRFSPDGKRIVVTDQGGHAIVWNAEDGERIHTLVHAQNNAWRVRISTNGEFIVTTGLSSVQTWSMDTGELVHAYDHMGSPTVSWIALSPNDELIASAAGNTVEVRSLKTGERVLDPLKHPNNVENVEFSPDSARLVTGTSIPDSRARTWSVATGRQISSPMPMESNIYSIRFSGDGARVFVGGLVVRGERALGVFDVETGEPLAAPLALPRGVRAMNFDPSNTRLATTSRAGLVHVWDVSPRAAHPLELRAKSSIYHTCFTPDGLGIGSLSRGGYAGMWSVESGSPLGEAETQGELFSQVLAGSKSDNLVRGHRFRQTTVNLVPSRSRLGAPFNEGPPREFAGTSDGNYLVTGGDDGVVRIYDPRSGSLRVNPIALESRILFLNLNQNESRAHVGTLSGHFHAIDLETGEIAFEAQPKEDVNRVSVIEDDGSGTVGIAYRGGSFRLLNENSGLDVQMKRHVSTVRNIEFIDAGRHVVTGSTDNTAIVWDAKTGAFVSQFTGHIDRACPWGLWIVQTSESTVVTGGSFDATLRAWDWRTGRAISPAMQGKTAAHSLAFDPIRGYVARGGDNDFIAGIWDPDTGQPLTGDLLGTQRVFSVSYSDDGRRFAAACLDGTLRVYDLPPTGQLPDWFLDFAEAYVGMRYDRDSLPHTVGVEKLTELRRGTLERSPNDDLAKWAIWLATEPSPEKTISPWSKRTRREAAAWLTQRNTIASLGRALSLVPDYPPALAGLAKRLVTRRQSDKSDALRADFCSQRALKLSPEDDEILSARAKVLFELDREAEAIRLLSRQEGLLDSPQLMFALAEILALHDLEFLAGPFFDRASQFVAPNSSDPDIEMHASLQRWRKAIEGYQTERLQGDQSTAVDPVGLIEILGRASGEQIQDGAREFLLSSRSESASPLAAWELFGLSQEIEAQGANQVDHRLHLEAAMFCYQRARVPPTLLRKIADRLSELESPDQHSLIAYGEEWAYHNGISPVDPNWAAAEFSAKGWPVGAAPLGYGNGTETTRLSYGSNASNKPLAVYFRKVFHRPATLDRNAPLTLQIQCDDGAVVYVNGREACRVRMGSGAVDSTTTAIARADSATEESYYHQRAIDPALLVPGENTIAIEVHQVSPESSDIGFELSLIAGLPTTEQRIALLDETSIRKFLNLPGAAAKAAQP